MSDQANLLFYLEECKRLYKARDFLGAAINAYWCLQYCRYGEPYGISYDMLFNAESESSRIFRSASSKFNSSILSKTTFVYGTICPKLLWLYKNKYNLRQVSDATQKKFDNGHLVGNLAQKLFPGGIDVSDVSSERIIDMSRISLPFNLKQQLWLDKTKENLDYPSIYEAAFVSDDVFAAVDILSKEPRGYVAYEVKSSKAVSDTFIKDCALQYYVINKNIKLEDFLLIYINEKYLNEIQLPLESLTESNVDIERLFIKESVLSNILPLQSYISEQISSCKSVLKKGEPREIMGNHCNSPYDCMFKSYCKNKGRFEYDIW